MTDEMVLNPCPELEEWAKQFVKDHRDSIDYFINHGSRIEKALAQSTLEIAEHGGIYTTRKELERIEGLLSQSAPPKQVNRE